jgi:hypothetical protein
MGDKNEGYMMTFVVVAVARSLGVGIGLAAGGLVGRGRGNVIPQPIIYYRNSLAASHKEVSVPRRGALASRHK